jgi:hypothetical protein
MDRVDRPGTLGRSFRPAFFASGDEVISIRDDHQDAAIECSPVALSGARNVNRELTGTGVPTGRFQLDS